MANSLHLVCPQCDTVNRIPAQRLGDGPRCGSCKQPLFRGQPLETNAASFHAHLSRDDIPVLVDFWAPWCGPCRMMAPAYAQAAAQLEPGVRLLKLNTEDHQAVGAQYSIRSIPTLALFRQGREVARQAGAMQLPQLLQWVRAHLG